MYRNCTIWTRVFERINDIRSAEVQEGQDTEISSCDISLQDVTFAYNEDTPVFKRR